MKINIFRHTIITLCCLISAGLVAQTSESLSIPLTNPNAPGSLIVHIIDGSITVEGYNGKEVIVEARGNTKSNSWKNKRQDKKAINGMKRIEDNSLSFTVEENKNRVYVKYQPGKWEIDFHIKVPRDFSVDLRTINHGNILVEGVSGTHEVSNTNGKVTMNNISGSVVADALNKDIIVTFNAIDKGANMMFSSLNGDVDVTFPSTLEANVNASSDNGNIYTDFDIKRNKNPNKVKTSNEGGLYRVRMEKGITGIINGGGAAIGFKTLNGDILIRSN